MPFPVAKKGLPPPVPLMTQPGPSPAPLMLDPQQPMPKSRAARPVGGLAQMLAAHGGPPGVVRAAHQIEATPGASQLLYTVAAKKLMAKAGIPKSKTKKLRLYNAGPGTGGASALGAPALARGGDVRAAANKTRRAGRNNDSMMLHLAPDEYRSITQMWGKPDINPNTGIGEYGFLSDAWSSVTKAVKKVTQSPIFKMVAPIALEIFAPELAPEIGTALGASSEYASIAGSAVIGAGLGGLEEGKKGLVAGGLSGAVQGGLGQMAGEKMGLSGKTADVVGSAVLQGAGSKLTGGDFGQGAVEGGLNAAIVKPMQQSAAAAGRNALGLNGPATPPTGGLDLAANGLDAASPTDTSQGPLPGLGGAGYTPPPGSAEAAAPKGDSTDMSKYLMPALMLAGASSGSGSAKASKPPPMPPGWNSPLPAYSIDRSWQGLDDPSQYYTYGQVGAPTQGQHLFFTPNPSGGLATVANANPALGGVPRTAGAAHGGVMGDPNGGGVGGGSRYVRGPGTGRSDDIDAKLSDGEYVMDAETVALLGDGSGDAGAKRLDEMREQLRKHKAEKLAKGGFSSKAKPPLNYIGGMRQLRAAAGRT